jgi:hypothetical protein
MRLGSECPARRPLVTAEQGVGDQIMFASLIPELAERARTDGGAVTLECEPRLQSLFARSFPTVRVHAAQMETKGGVTTSHYGWLKQAGGANAAVEMGSLPRHMRSAVELFPNPHAFLIPDAQEAAHWRNAFAQAGSGPHVGVCWRSGKMGGLRSLQFAPLTAWAECMRTLPGTIVCVQYDATLAEVAQLSALSGREIFVPPGLDQKRELDRTCAMLSALDHVLSAPTAVSWLAAGAGVPTSKILYDTSWTSFGTTYEPFAPACACIAPATRGDWRDVFAQAIRHVTVQSASLL